MTDWSQLTHAYGRADDIPALLAQAGSDPNSPAWSELWSRLCHQGGTCSASYAVLPHLADLVRHVSGADRAKPLVLAGAILASDDWPADIDRPQQRYAADAAELHRLTEETLADPGLHADATLYVHLLQALLAFEGVEVWGRELDSINDGEYEVPCPHCETENFIAFGQYGTFSTLDDMYMKTTNTDRKRLPLLPANPETMDGPAKRIHDRAISDGHPDVAAKLTYVFGRAHCADCGELFRVDEAVLDRWGD